MDFDVASVKIAGLCSKISILKQQEMTSFVHCAKINSLIQAFKTLPNDLIEFARYSEKPSKPPVLQAVADLTSVTDELIQLCIQCVHDSGVQFVLTSSTSEVFNHFFSIRETAIKSLQTLGLDKGVKTFSLTPEKLICQDQVDLKQISTILAQIKNEYNLDERKDISKALKDRFTSLQRKNIRISEDVGDELLTIPSLPSAVNLAILHEQIQYGKEIGHGYSGHVYEGKIAGSDEKVAIKVLNSLENNTLLLRSLKTEITTLSILQHPSILRLVGYTREQPFCLVTELMTNGSLADFLVKRPNELSPTDRTIIAIDVARGMQYIHEKTLIHRDLKSFNIFLDGNKRAKIGDFGLVRVKSYEPSTGMIGTPQWMAPEVMMCSPTYNQKVDVYSYAIVMWELLTNEKPYSKIPIQQLPTMIVKDNFRPTIPENTPPKLRDLIVNCWDADPVKRPTFAQILQMLEEKEYHFLGTDEEELKSVIGFDKYFSIYSSNSEISLHTSDDTSISDEDIQQVLSKANELLEEGVLTNSIEKIELAATDIYSLSNALANLSPPRSIELEYSTMETSEASTKEELQASALGKVNSAEQSDALSEIGQTKKPLKKKDYTKLIKRKVLPKLLQYISTSGDEIKPALLTILSDLLRIESVYHAYINLNGEQIIIDLMNMNNSLPISAAALAAFSRNINKSNVTRDTIKAVLKFAGCPNIYVRTSALELLVTMTQLNPELVQNLPSFVYHFLTFTIKDLPVSAIKSLVQTALIILKKATTLEASVVDQLIFIYDHSQEREIKSIVIQCLIETVKFEEPRHEFSKEFWRKATEELDLTENLFLSLTNYITSITTNEVLDVLATVSAYNKKALDIFIIFAEKKPDVVIRYLPINSDDTKRVLTLYSKIPSFARNQFELYIACRDGLSDFNLEQISLDMIRTMTNFEYFKNSGIIDSLFQLINTSSNNQTFVQYLMMNPQQKPNSSSGLYTNVIFTSSNAQVQQYLNFFDALFYITKIDCDQTIASLLPITKKLSSSKNPKLSKEAREFTSLINSWKHQMQKKEKEKKKHRHSDSGVLDAQIPVKIDGRKIVSSPNSVANGSKPSKQPKK